MRSQKTLGWVLTLVAGIALVAGCVRKIDTAPSNPIVVTATPSGTVTPPVSTNTFTAIPTNTKTNTPVMSNTFTRTFTATFTTVPSNTFTRTATPTFTFTPTNTGANTATNTYTITATSSFTPTATPTFTFTPTNTGANTATNTFTATATSTSTTTFTPTNTGANTATFTFTPTPTTACPQAFTNNYPFTAGIGCWMTNNALGTTTVDWAAGPAGSTSGGGAFHANVAYSAVSQLTEEFEVPLPANTDLTNHLITMKIYIDNAVKGTAWGGGIQTYIKTGAGTVFCNKPWVNITGFGSWQTYTMDLNVDCASGVADVRAIGVQVIIAAGGGSGNIYIDDVTINPIPTPTPTPTWTVTDTPGGATATFTPTLNCPEPVSPDYTFDGDLRCWMTNNALGSTTVDWAAGPAGSISGGGAFHANVAYSAVSQLTEEFEVPLPANTDLTNALVTMHIYIDNAVKGTAWGGGIQTYIKTTASTVFCNKPWVNITGFGSWQTYTIDLSTDCTANTNDVRAIGVQVIIAAGGGAGNIYIDDVTVAPGTPANTPTFTQTPTDTDTPVPGATDTFTFTPTPTGAAATATATSCTGNVAYAYTFDSSLDCWALDATATSVTNYGLSGTTTHTGAGSLFATIDGALGSTAQFNLVYSTPGQDLTGTTISAWIWVDATLAGASVQVYGLSPGWSAGGWTDFTVGNSNLGKWVKVSFLLNSPTVDQIGFQFYNLAAGMTGNVYIDDVTLAGPPPPVCQSLLNSFETLGENGTATGGNSTLSLSASHTTDGASSLDINIVTASGWNDSIFKLAGFTPAVMGPTYKHLMADVYVDSAVLGGGYSQLFLYGDGGGQNYKAISSTQPNLVAGQQTLVWDLDFPDAAIPSTTSLDDFFFIYNNGGPAGGAGHIYIDNVRLATCP